MVFNLEKQFVFYASYHNTPVNIAIHLICIWPILATGLVLMQVCFAYFRRILKISYLQYTPEIVDKPEFFSLIPNGEYFKVNVAFITALIYIGELALPVML